GLERTPYHRAVLVAGGPAGGGLDPHGHRQLALVIDALDLLNDRNRRFRLARGPDESRYILGKTRAAVPGAGMEELVADAPVLADRRGHLLHIGTDRFAMIRNFIDEADLERQKCIGGI